MVMDHLSALRVKDYVNDETDVSAALANIFKRMLLLSR